MRRLRHLLIAVIGAVVMSGPTTHAQPTDQMHRIGVLGGTTGPELTAFQERLQALGWIVEPVTWWDIHPSAEEFATELAGLFASRAA